jgi:N6-L-threonylcarbamoyladenine synthase
MVILSIETSCDETAAAVTRSRANGSAEILSHIVYSQIPVHQKFGGVFPEAASREHVKKIGPVIEQAVKDAAGTNNPHEWIAQNVNAIAVTAGPGLIGSLLVGVAAAKALAYGLDKPLLGINHHEGHLMAAWITDGEPPAFPALGLVVSGGHTKLLYMESPGVFRELGRTRDDAVGESFDKVARLLGLPYPGGRYLDDLAATYRARGGISSLDLPRPMLDSGTYEFSFSGLKTAVARIVAQRGELNHGDREEISAAFQAAASEVLVGKVSQAIQEFTPRSVIMAGGVAASAYLRDQMAYAVSRYPGVQLHIPPVRLCTDNAAMVGAAALLRLEKGERSTWQEVRADETMDL